jgi:hypothetical protein
MKINYVNSDHIQALVDLPANIEIEDLFHLYKEVHLTWSINKLNISLVGERDMLHFQYPNLTWIKL